MARYENLNVNRLTVSKVLEGPGAGTSSAQWACTSALTTTTAGGDTTETVTHYGADASLDYVLGQYSTTDDTDTIAEMEITAANTVTYIASADPSTAHAANTMIFRQGGVAEWVIVAAGDFTTAGGDATERIVVPGALAADRCLVTITNSGTNDVTIAAAACGAGDIDVTLSADPSTDCTMDYVVFRQVGLAEPTHYIAAMGQYTAVAGDTTTVGPFTATGVLASDQIILIHATSDDTDTIADVVPGAGTITLTVSADPVTDHSYTWAAVRKL